MESIGIGTINNYCSAVTIWNLMLETDFNGSIPSNNGGHGLTAPAECAKLCHEPKHE